MRIKTIFSRICRHDTITLSAIIGITKAANKCVIAVILPISESWSSEIEPLPISVPNPNHVGVPTAPNDTGTEFIISARIATCKGLNPKPTNKGAAIAAGVPKPLAPSIIKAKAQPIIISWATGLGLILPSQRRNTFIAPVISIIRLKSTAPKITVIGVATEIIALIKLAFRATNEPLK